MGRGAVMARPAVAPGVVGPPLRVVGEDGVGGDEEAVALQAHLGWQVGSGGGGSTAVGVVQLYERVESVFRVDLAAFTAENLVRGGSAVGMDCLGPAQIRLLAMRMLGEGAQMARGAGVKVEVEVVGRGCMAT